MTLASEQVRAARALLRMEQKELAERSKVSLPSIKRLEAQPGPLAAQARTVDAIRAALEAAGVVFLPDGGTRVGGPGVRLANVGPDPLQGPVDAPVVRAGREMKSEHEAPRPKAPKPK